MSRARLRGSNILAVDTVTTVGKAMRTSRTASSHNAPPTFQITDTGFAITKCGHLINLYMSNEGRTPDTETKEIHGTAKDLHYSGASGSENAGRSY